MVIQLLVPIILFVALSFITVLAAYLYYRWEWKALLIFVPLIIMHIIKPVAMINAQSFYIAFITGIICGYAVKKEKGFHFYLVGVSVIVTILLLAGQQFINKDPVVKAYTKKEFTVLLDKYQVPADFKNEILKDYNQVKQIFRAIPYFIFISVLLFSGIAFIFIKMMFARVFDKRIEGLEFFKLNDYTIFLLIGSWAACIWAWNRSSFIIESWSLNIALVITTFYFIQALGILKFALIKKGMPRYILPFFVILILSNIIVGTIVSVLLTGLGALDLWADFRKLNSNNNE